MWVGGWKLNRLHRLWQLRIPSAILFTYIHTCIHTHCRSDRPLNLRRLSAGTVQNAAMASRMAVFVTVCWISLMVGYKHSRDVRNPGKLSQSESRLQENVITNPGCPVRFSIPSLARTDSPVIAQSRSSSMHSLICLPSDPVAKVTRNNTHHLFSSCHHHCDCNVTNRHSQSLVPTRDGNNRSQSRR